MVIIQDFHHMPKSANSTENCINYGVILPIHRRLRSNKREKKIIMIKNTTPITAYLKLWDSKGNAGDTEIKFKHLKLSLYVISPTDNV